MNIDWSTRVGHASGSTLRKNVCPTIGPAASPLQHQRFSTGRRGRSKRARSGTCCRSTTPTRSSALVQSPLLSRRMLRKLLVALLNMPCNGDSESLVDATLSSSNGGDDKMHEITRDYGLTLMAIVDLQGLPVVVGTHAANDHEVTLVQLSFGTYIVKAKSKNLFGDRACDSDLLHKLLRDQSIDSISHHKSNRTATRRQLSQRLRRYERRWVRKRLFAWFHRRRWPLVRCTLHLVIFLGLVQLACVFMHANRV
jgi:hypothetical protein